MAGRGAFAEVAKYAPPLEAIEAERCRRALRLYVERAWHVVEPAQPFVPGWHIDAICEHLEAVTRGEITRLLITCPPRFMKSLTVAVFWPTWSWTRTPATRWVCASYIEALATRDCVKARRLIQSPWYQKRFGSAFRLTSDQNEKQRYENDKSGLRVAYSVGGATGEGGDVALVDDAHNVAEGESEAHREGVLVWYDEVMATRLNNPKTGARVIIGQRVHERDLAGHVLAQGGYEHLNLPLEYEGVPCVTVLGPVERRTQPGELLWPARFDAASVAKLKREMTPFAQAAQLQQRPYARTGGKFQRGWFEIVDAAPVNARRVRYWDKAATEGGGKYTAGVREAFKDGMAYIEDVVRGQWGSAVREQTIHETAKLDGVGVRIIVEREPGSGGKDSADATIKRLAGYVVSEDRPTGDKFTRADPLEAAACAGNVKLVAGPWNEAFLRELEVAGPGAAFLDQMDAAAGAYNWLTLRAPPELTGVKIGSDERESPLAGLSFG